MMPIWYSYQETCLSMILFTKRWQLRIPLCWLIIGSSWLLEPHRNILGPWIIISSLSSRLVCWTLSPAFNSCLFQDWRLLGNVIFLIIISGWHDRLFILRPITMPCLNYSSITSYCFKYYFSWWEFCFRDLSNNIIGNISSGALDKLSSIQTLLGLHAALFNYPA